MTSGNRNTYTLEISRLTIEKLGVKLYDKVSAVVAELIANSYDADAENVLVEAPLGKQLAGTADSQATTYCIKVVDDGHGMTPDEVQDYFLKVGRDRRAAGAGTSSLKGRPVMGRKGIGKLAPFGICRRIEVLSGSGEPNAEGRYYTSDFIMDYEKLVVDDSQPAEIATGDRDGTYSLASRGTTISLLDFLPKRVPNAETFDWGETLRQGGVGRLRQMIGEAVPPAFTRLHGLVLQNLLADSWDRPLLPSRDVRHTDAMGRLEPESKAA